MQAVPAPKLRCILLALDVAQGPKDIDIPGLRMHGLFGRVTDHWSIWVNGSWVVTFRFIDGDEELLDHLDNHEGTAPRRVFASTSGSA